MVEPGASQSNVVSIVDVSDGAAHHMATGIGEFDRVLGGGLVPGGVVLVAGEPGVGKSTLLLQVAAAAARAEGHPVLIASGEESVQQIAGRARRIGVADEDLRVMSGRSIPQVVAAADELKPVMVVVDSIQTAVPSLPDVTAGTPTAVKLAAAEAMAWAKGSATPLVVVGHVTKDGTIAGPKVLEHAVDVVAHLEGDHHRDLRVLRCRKNRYGPTNRIGLFRLSGSGMAEVTDASEAMVGAWRGDAPGSIAFPALEGGRPITVEIQALVAATSAPQPRRSVRGIDSARVHQILAVLERHAGLDFRHHDVYVGVSSGLKVKEPAADLPVALALASSLVGRTLGRIGAWGEVGLTGDVRAVSESERRQEETQRIGLSGHLSPAKNMTRITSVLAAAGLVDRRE